MSTLTGQEIADRALDGQPLPATITLEQILAALKIIAQVIPIIDGLLPTLIRWWKEIFGTQEERRAARAYRVLKAAQKVIEAQGPGL